MNSFEDRRGRIERRNTKKRRIREKGRAKRVRKPTESEISSEAGEEEACQNKCEALHLPPFILMGSITCSAYLNLNRHPLLKPFRVVCNKARFVARRRHTVSVQQLQRPLWEYMKLPASQYSVLDAERIERVDDSTFRCYVYGFKFLSFQVCPVILVRVQPQPKGCTLTLLSCSLEGSPLLSSLNPYFDASMVNQISCDSDQSSSDVQQLTSDAVIEVSIDVPVPFRAIPVDMVESSGTRVLEQILKIMLPRFMEQLVKDYQAWASGDTSRQPLGTGQI